MAPDELGLDHLPQKDFVVITPVLVDPATAKKVNIGDGFIMDSSLKLIGARPRHVFSSRMPITEEKLDVINSSKLVLVAGANTLKTHFEPTPGFSPELLARIKPPIALCGIGHYGVPEATAQPLDAPSQAIMRTILARFPFVSVRCDESAAYLRASIPDLLDNVVMTSCPVVFPVDGIDKGFARQATYKQFVYTLTDRANLEAQARAMEGLNRLISAERRILALHQDYGNASLANYAKSLGYEVFASPRYQDFLSLYAETDLHIGNRLHAHLKCLSYGVRSFLLPFDLRQQFFADSLDFPLIRQLPNPELDTYDFGRARARIAAAKPQMDRFVAAARAVLDS